jgi:hypothetical protein
MATQADVRRIAMSLAGTQEEDGRFAFGVEHKGKVRHYVWSWLERIDPKKARVPSREVVAVRVSGGDEKAALIAADAEKFFTEPHYNGYPAVLVRLRAVTVPELRALLTEAWQGLAPAPKAPKAKAPKAAQRAKAHGGERKRPPPASPRRRVPVS